MPAPCVLKPLSTQHYHRSRAARQQMLPYCCTSAKTQTCSSRLLRLRGLQQAQRHRGDAEKKQNIETNATTKTENGMRPKERQGKKKGFRTLSPTGAWLRRAGRLRLSTFFVPTAPLLSSDSARLARTRCGRPAGLGEENQENKTQPRWVSQKRSERNKMTSNRRNEMKMKEEQKTKKSSYNTLGALQQHLGSTK